MPAVPFGAGLPTLSEVASASFDHLIEAADYYERAGKVTEHAFTELRDSARHPGGTEWGGQAAQADQYCAEMDLVAITPAVLQWHDAAAICRDGYEQMEATRRAVLDAANGARRDGFEVGDDYTVTDTRPSSTRQEQTARQAQGKAHAAYISHRVAALASADHDIATRLTTASEGLDGIAFQEAPTAADDTIVGDDEHNGVRPVDRTWKQDPAPTPDPNDPGRHPDYPDHKPDGTWARSNSGLDGYPEEQQALDEREKQTGIPIERQKVRVTLTDPNTGRTLTREYDGLEPIPGQPGQYRGLEHKLGTAGLTPNQRQLDGLVDSGTPAQGTLDGKPIEVIDTRVMKTPQPFPAPAEGLPGVA
ncbi:MAG: hypothetical protein J2P17_16535, partial [Mycobacterium sp.]|nr:hypothetical protein [Mycobacterium sp.]